MNQFSNRVGTHLNFFFFKNDNNETLYADFTEKYDFSFLFLYNFTPVFIPTN